MDAAHVFRQGLGTITPRQHHLPNQPSPRHHAAGQDDLSDGEQNGNRVAHTLTACCRCRQRKTRCDPTLPRCLPCERSGSVCEYLDPAKGRRINRFYVVKLQDKVRALEAELEQYTGENEDVPRTYEDIVRPGGMIRLHASDDSPRYLGPSSGISMSRLLMEQAKRYTDSKSISELIPELRARRAARMQSIQMTGSSASRQKSYPVVSDGPAETLPPQNVANRLVDIFNQKAQNFWPCLHEKVFQRDLDAVYANDPDPYRNFVVRMVLAISLQKLEIQYAGLADSYLLAAMQYFQDVIQPKDLKTLQCLVLLAQYSLLTPTRMPVYYVTGLAVRICQQEGYTDETTIGGGFNVDPLTLDMRRRLVWAVHAMELGLSHVLGRPNFFGRGTDRMKVNYFATVDDEYITEDGIEPAPVSQRKVTAIHFYKMRLLQADLRKSLYEVKRPQPKTDSHPWFEQQEARLRDWLEACPSATGDSKEWFKTRYDQMKVMLYRPSPQIPKPSPRAANICFESSAAIITHAFQQAQHGRTDITWVFLLTLNMSLNTILWATSYPEVRQCHTRAEVEELVNKTLDCLDRCSVRWPSTTATMQLYTILSKACLQSYESGNDSGPVSAGSTMSPPDITETQPTPPAQFSQQTQPPVPYLNPPQFGYVFDSPPEAMNAYTFDPNYPPPQPTFRSNSIFQNPASDEQHPRRFSYFPPEFMQPGDPAVDATVAVNEAALRQNFPSPPSLGQQMPTPPDSMKAGAFSATNSRTTLSPDAREALSQIPNMETGAEPPPPAGAALSLTPPQGPLPNRMPPQGSPLADLVPPQSLSQAQPPQPTIQQRPLPQVTTSMADWFAPQPTFAPSYSYGPPASNPDNLFGDMMNPAGPIGDVTAAGLGLQSLGDLGMSGLGAYQMAPYRQGSLTQSQQMELMSVLETEGLGDIDAYLSAGTGPSGTKFF